MGIVYTYNVEWEYAFTIPDEYLFKHIRIYICVMNVRELWYCACKGVISGQTCSHAYKHTGNTL